MIALYHREPEQLDFAAEVLSCVPAGEGCFDVVLSDTAFYPTGGGQPCDLGELDGFPVEDVRKEGDIAPIVHRVRAPHVLRGTVRGRVDAARRLDHCQQHTGQHMLSHVLSERFDAYSLGLHIGREDAYVDLQGADAAPMTRELADELEDEVNRWIARDEPVRCLFPTEEELPLLPLRKKPDPHAELRIVCIGEKEAVACCGTHARSTGQVQAVRILSWQQSHGNLRLFFLAGLRALRWAYPRAEAAERAAQRFSCGAQDLLAAIERLQAQNATLAHRVSALTRAQAEAALRALQPIATAAGPLYAACLPGADASLLRECLGRLSSAPRAVCFLCAPPQEGGAAALGVGAGSPLHAGQALRALLQVFGGKGGGRADSAFGRCDSMDIPRAAAILTELCGGAVPIDTTEA